MPTDVANGLAQQYFNIANAIVGFHVLQTILFFNAAYKEPVLRNTLAGHRRTAAIFTCAFAAVYALVVIGCGHLETILRSASKEASQVAFATLWGIRGRVGIVIILALLSCLIIAFIRPQSQQEPPPT